MRRRHTLLGLGGAAIVSLTGQARAQAAFPSQPIKIVVPYPPGGLTDVAARLIEVIAGCSVGEYLAKRLFEPLGMNETASVIAVSASTRARRSGSVSARARSASGRCACSTGVACPWMTPRWSWRPSRMRMPVTSRSSP